jgi:hypothetical protein
LPRGTSLEYTAARLARDHPELARSVAEGKLSPHKAAIRAGFRRPTTTVRIDNMPKLATSLRKKLTPSQVEELIAAKKPIIGHNMIYDIIYLYNQFIDDLPQTYPEFI